MQTRRVQEAVVSLQVLLTMRIFIKRDRVGGCAEGCGGASRRQGEKEGEEEEKEEETEGNDDASHLQQRRWWNHHPLRLAGRGVCRRMVASGLATVPTVPTTTSGGVSVSPFLGGGEVT